MKSTRIVVLTQVRHGTIDFSDFEAAEMRNYCICSGDF
jgi:hypothetical protein